MLLVVVGAVVCVVLVGSLCLNWMLRRARRNRRAALLVRQVLTQPEVRQLQSLGYLDVQSPSTADRVYRIPAQPGFVAVMDGGTITAWLCAQPVRSLPAAEHVLVHKLLLEGAEAEYLRAANRFSSLCSWRASDRDQVAVWTARAPGVLRER